MFSSRDLDELKNQIMSHLGQGMGSPTQPPTPPPKQGGGNNPLLQITPATALVIAGLLTDVLQVNSILISKDQHIEILLIGSLERKTPLDLILEQVGPMPFDDVLKAILKRVD